MILIYLQLKIKELYLVELKDLYQVQQKIIIDTISYETAKTINQLDGILYLGNLTGTSDIGYQKYANNIKLTSVVKDIEDFDQYWATVDELETFDIDYEWQFELGEKLWEKV